MYNIKDSRISLDTTKSQFIEMVKNSNIPIDRSADIARYEKFIDDVKAIILELKGMIFIYKNENLEFLKLVDDVYFRIGIGDPFTTTGVVTVISYFKSKIPLVIYYIPSEKFMTESVFLNIGDIPINSIDQYQSFMFRYRPSV